MSLTLKEVMEALGYPEKGAGGLGSGGPASLVFENISTDTRTLQPGDLFVALIGKEADGHQFIPQALRAGAGGLIVSQPVVASLDTPALRVPDTEVAYGLLARHWRDRFAIPVVGVTGSVGKTTVKEMLAAALGPLGPILKTEASQNNETGVPKTLLQLTPKHEAAVIEMGMRGAGQIAYLCGIARPTVGVVTVIADNHLELLGSRDAIAHAKGELVEDLPADGTAVLNADDPYLEYLRSKASSCIRTYGFGEAADFRAEAVTRTDTGWQFTVRGVPVALHALSKHDIGNALAALAVADSLGVPLGEAALALQEYAPPSMRMQVVKTAWGGTILNDAYNAAPASVKSALETLTAHGGGRKIAFLGDMRELGARAEEAHRELGQVIDNLGGLDALFTVGGLAVQIPGAAQRFADSKDAALFARDAFKSLPGDVILVKGSRAMAMEKIAEAFTSGGPDEA